MSQITRCPSCTTTFKVVADQLRISQGWVRCGQCNEVFDASENLLALDAAELLPSALMKDVRNPPDAAQGAAAPESAPADKMGSTPLFFETPSFSQSVAPKAVAGPPEIPATKSANTAPWTSLPDALPMTAEQAAPAFLMAGAQGEVQGFQAPPPAAWESGPTAKAVDALESIIANSVSSAHAFGAPDDLRVRDVDKEDFQDLGRVESVVPESVGFPEIQRDMDPPADEKIFTWDTPVASASSERVDDEPAKMLRDLPGDAAPSALAASRYEIPDVPPLSLTPREEPELTLASLKEPVLAVGASASLGATAPSQAAETAHDTSDDGQEVSFVVAARRKAFWRKPAVRAVLALLLVLSMAVLALQVAVHERDRIVAWDARTKPWFQQICQPLQCSLKPLRQISDVVIDSSSFNKARGDSYQLLFTLKNLASVGVAVPAMELTLTDAQDQPVLRRVLLAADLNAPTELSARGEWSVTVPVIVTTGGARVAGYRLLAFYP